MDGTTSIRDQVREYYGTILQSSSDLETGACCNTEAASREQLEALSLIHPEILAKTYGCGSPIPPALEGCTVLDLGCGAGRDAYLAANLVGPAGSVVGVDMTAEQLAVARRHVGAQMARFGYARPNVEFRQGYIEDLAACGIADDSVDVVISNCVINLSPDKERVFAEIFRVLKPGGELYFSDVFAGRRVLDDLQRDPVLRGECLAGALYVEDFRRLLRRVGCLDHRVVSRRSIALDNPAVEATVGMIDYQSLTIRAFKLPGLEDICEDYGQTAVYLGTVDGMPHRFPLDDHHLFIAGKVMLVCGNTAAMLGETRLARHFRLTGDRSVHFGPFDCAPMAAKAAVGDTSSGGACC